MLAMLQQCMHLVADSVPVECVLSGVCAVRDHGVHAVLQLEYMQCYNDAYVLLQILFLSSMFCLVFAMSQCVLLQILFLSSLLCLVFITLQRWMCLVSGSVLVKHVLSGVLSGVCDVTMMYASCCRLRSCQACSLWCLRCYNDACILLQILFLLKESGVCSV